MSDFEGAALLKRDINHQVEQASVKETVQDLDQLRKLEMETKKLMTVAKSKYYMLKVNFPKQAQIIDEEPLIDTH